MSITNDLRTYAGIARDQGREALEQAQSQLSDVTGQANEIVGKLSETTRGNVAELTGKAAGAVQDLRLQVERAVNVEALKAAVEPYLAQARGYTALVTDRAEEFYSTVRDDKRVARLVATADSVTGVVIETLAQRVVAPVRDLAGRRATSSTPRSAATPGSPRVAKGPAAKATARKAPAKKAAPTA